MLEVRQITKRFPGVLALNGVSTRFEPGTCHALMGENGAGKSTLGKIVAGLYAPDSGELLLNGVPQHFHSPLDAQRAGINIVHQELLFCENLSVAENLNLASIPTRGGFVDQDAMRLKAHQWLEAIGAEIDPDALVGSLPIAQQQLVQIAGALGTGAKILIFDEPTSSLGAQETRRLLELIRGLKESGVAIVYVSHRLDEVFEVCDTVTVLRDGQLVDTLPLESVNRERLVSMMVGREVDLTSRAPIPSLDAAHVIFEVHHLSSQGKFKDISFALKGGEILGIGGLVGAGRTELLEALFGLDPKVTGSITMHGRPLSIAGTTNAVRAGLGLIPEDRKRHGLVLSMNCKENISLPTLDRMSAAAFINRAVERSVSQRFFDRMRVKAPRLETLSVALSGGNQQKLVLAKWLAANCDVLLVDEPTRGVDVGAKAEIHALLRELAAEGKGVIVVSSEMPELLALSHRIIVLHGGQIAGEESGQDATEATIMRKMAGIA